MALTHLCPPYGRSPCPLSALMQNRSRFVFEDDGLVPNDPMPFVGWTIERRLLAQNGRLPCMRGECRVKGSDWHSHGSGEAAIATSLSELPNVISNFSIEKIYTTIPSYSPDTNFVSS